MLTTEISLTGVIQIFLPSLPGLVFAVALSFCSVTAAWGDASRKEIAIYIVGDSTVADGGEDQLVRGWGRYIHEHFDSTVKVVNDAEGGASSKSFQQQGSWRQVLHKRPNFVLIQFGHNDSIAENEGDAHAPVDFRDCLKRYVVTARNVNATPILVTPMRIRTFKGGRVVDQLSRYAEETRAIAAELKVPLIYLYSLSTTLFESIGSTRVQQLASAPNDYVHFNELGARALSEIVSRQLRKFGPPLSERYVDVSR